MTLPADGHAPSTAEALDFDLPAQDDGKRHLPVVKRRRSGRPHTVSMRRQSKRDLERGREAYPDEAIEGHEYPQVRSDCLPGGCNEVRPCPYVLCKHHLYLDVNERNGNIKMNFPDADPLDLPETCSLDVADRGGITLEEVGAIMNLTRERIRQLEDISLARLKALAEMSEIAESESLVSRPRAATFDDGSGARTGREAVDGLTDFCHWQEPGDRLSLEDL